MRDHVLRVLERRSDGPLRGNRAGPVRCQILLAEIVLLSVMASLPACAAELRLPDFQRTELPNGLTLYVAADTTLPIVTVRVALPGGQAVEPRSKKGLARITAQCCLLGVPGLESTALLMEQQRLGSEFGAWADFDHSFFALTCLRDHWTAALELLARALITPTFPEKEVARLRGQAISEESRKRRDPASLAWIHAYDLLYDGPLGWPGSVEGSRRVSRGDLVRFCRSFYVPNHAVLVAVGDFDRDAATEILRAAFETWPGGSEPPEPAPSTLRRDAPKMRLVNKPGLTQATIACIQPGPTASDSDRFAYRLGNAVLGGTFNSRLMDKLRSKGGKTYDAGSSTPSQLRYGQTYLYTFTRNAELTAAVESIHAVVAPLARDGVRAEELDTARRAFLGGMILGLETPPDAANGLLRGLASGRTLDEYRALPASYEGVTLDQANEAIRGRLRPDSLRWVIVADRQKIASALAHLGPYETVDSRDPLRPGNLVQRSRLGVGLAWNRVGRGPRVSLLHRWVGLYGTYGPRSWNTRWERKNVFQAGLDLHRTSAERGSASLYIGTIATWKGDRRAISPHVGFRLFPSAFGDRWSFSCGLGGTFWSRGPRSEFVWGIGLDRFF